MTTLAYRDGILAGDTLAIADDGTFAGEIAHVFELEGGRLIGITSGAVGLVENLAKFFHATHHVHPLGYDEIGWPPICEGSVFDVLMIEPDGSVYTCSSQPSFSGPVRAPFYSLGSGSRYALGAMEMGADASQAVATALKFDPWTGGEVFAVLNAKLCQNASKGQKTPRSASE